MTTQPGPTRTPRRSGSTAVSAADIDPAGAALAAEVAAHDAAAVNEKERARTAAANVKETTGWDCVAGAMSLTCTRAGHVPLIVHRSTLDEAADAAVALLSDGTDRTLRHADMPAAPSGSSVEGDVTTQADQDETAA